MDESVKTAIEVLTEIAKDRSKEADTRVRAACAILGYESGTWSRVEPPTRKDPLGGAPPFIHL